MKRLVVPILFLISLCVYRIDNVQAMSGSYTYDINSVTLVSSSEGEALRFKGWVYMNDYNNTDMHNIAPVFTMQLHGVTSSGGTIYSKVYPNSEERPSYSEAYADPHDYSKAWFTKTSWPTPLYYHDPGYGSQRAQDILESRNRGLYNYFDINIDFTFDIPLSHFSNLSKNGARKIYMYITASTDGATKTVYGYSFSTQAVTKTFAIGIQSNRLPDSLKRQLAEKSMTFQNPITQVTSVVELGMGRPQPNLDVKTYYYYNGSRLINSSSCNVYYYNAAESGSAANYTVLGSQRLTSLDAAKEPVYSYNVNVSLGGSCFDGRLCLSNGGGYSAWIPSFWVTPISGQYTYIEVVDCKTEPTCVPSPTTSCPTACCTEVCDTAKNKPTQYCTKTCKIPPPDICTSSDPQKQYCCWYPDDPICNTPVCTGDNCYPTPDPSTNKTGTCKSSGTTDVTFKYPSTGWGKILISNNACTISCQEKLKATFQPSQPVRAGMGFTYPFTINSSRYCAADYDNPGWKTKVDNAATRANTNYNNMVNSLNNAKSLDTACGTKQTLTSVPTCSCGTRSGNTCRGCTCSRRVFDHTERYSCGSATAPRTCTRSVYRTEYYTCTKSASCPSGYSYRSSLDRCAKDVCSRNNSKTWSSAQAEISSQISAASSYRSAYNSYTATVNSLKGERSTCDNYVANNPYRGATSSSVSVNAPNQSTYSITSATTSEDKSYENARQSTWTTYAIYQCNNRSYSAPSLIGDYRSSASSFTGTYCNHQTANQSYRDFWNKKTDAKVSFEFSTTYYVQRYTGTLSTYSQSGYDYHGRYSYTDFYAKSQSNNFNVITRNIGPNLPTVSNSLWSINPFTCQYNVTNMIFPPAGDPQNTKYGNVAFMYRQISLTDPFPNRNPGENWSGKTNLITSNGYKVYGNTPLYAITLSPGTMQTIRGYGTNYGSFYVTDPYRSQIVETYTQNGIIVKRR